MGKWHLIVDLLSPEDSGVIDEINPDEFTLHRITVDQVIGLVSQFSTWHLELGPFGKHPLCAVHTMKTCLA